MIKRNQTVLNRISAFVDLLLVIFSYLFSTWLRFYVLHGWRGNMALTRRMMFAACVYAAGLLVVLALMGFYGTTRTRKLSWRLKVLFIGVTITVLIASALLFVFRLMDFSRGLIVIFYGISLLLLGGKYIGTKVALDQLRRSGFNIKHEVVIGTGTLAAQYQRDVLDVPELGLKVEEALDPTDAENLERALARNDIDEAIIALEATEYQHITGLIRLCEKNGVKYMVIPFYNDLIPANPVIENVGRSKLINMRANRLEDIGWAGLKRAFDVAVSGVGLLILSPFLLGIAIGVKLSSPGPILFRQTRVGYNRKNFQMLKFRSMKVNATSDTAWSTNTDSRRTRFGSFIRKTSLDELPQLWNVFRGDMSLVGPRPELPHFVEQFKETIPFYMVKHQVKPGITGWAQVNGYRGDISIEKRIELDLWYIENWSFGLDLKILFQYPDGYLYVKAKGPTAIWYEGEGEAKPVRLAIIICTYKREAQVTRNLEILANTINADELLSECVEVYCVDNGQTVTVVPPGIHLISNRNFGGSGGYARGMMAASHCAYFWLMDDDITFEPTLLRRVVTFLKYRAEEVRLAAGLFNFETPTIQREATAAFDGYTFHSNCGGLDLSEKAALLENKIVGRADYGGWWSMVVPNTGELPMPFFIKLDDVEFGLRQKRPLTIMNGFGVWHEAFGNKANAWSEYYTTRNTLIIQRMYPELGHSAFKTMGIRLLKALAYGEPKCIW